MCKCANKLLSILSLMWLAATLTACGGAASGDGGSTTSAINKPTLSSIASSSIVEQSSSSSQSSTAELTSASSTSQSSSSVYSRIPRSSSASVSSQSDGSDITPPAVTELQLYRLSERNITLIWDDATDNVGISHYTIKRNNNLIAIVDYPAQMFADQNLLPATDYTYTITSFDTAGNNSGESIAFNIRTLALANSSTASTNSSANSKSSNSSLRSSSKSSSSSLRSSSSSSSKSSTGTSSSSSSKSSANSSSTSSSASSKSSSSSSTASSAAIETITITWGHPNQREDGSFLELEDIGGYEIRYRKPTGARYTYINLNGNRTTEYVFTGPVRDLEFEIAVFDTTGLYSRYVKITR
ncbi:hypothetical protein [Cellvibrio sp.]